MMCDLFNVTLDDLVKGTIPFVPTLKCSEVLTMDICDAYFMTLAAILMGPLVVY